VSTPVKLLIHSEIPGLGDKVEIESIRRKLIDHLSEITPRINLDHLNHWALLISICMRSTSGIGVFKRAARYPSEKEFEVSISMTVPDSDQATYGLPNVKTGFFQPLNERSFHLMQPVFEQYDNLNDYIFESAKAAINEGFRHGFTCNAQRIRFQS
jgi:transcriptional antiterminator